MWMWHCWSRNYLFGNKSGSIAVGGCHLDLKARSPPKARLPWLTLLSNFSTHGQFDCRLFSLHLLFSESDSPSWQQCQLHTPEACSCFSSPSPDQLTFKLVNHFFFPFNPNKWLDILSFVKLLLRTDLTVPQKKQISSKKKALLGNENQFCNKEQGWIRHASYIKWYSLLLMALKHLKPRQRCHVGDVTHKGRGEAQRRSDIHSK